jgi:signal transduction histidine kinase
LSSGQQTFVERAYACNERQLRIVEDILRVAQVDLDKVDLHLQPTEITQIVADIVETQQGMILGRNQKLILKLSEPHIIVNIDQDRFRMALDNIVDNASKYSHQDTTITVSVIKKGSSSVEIRVSDKGVGIDKSELPKLFQKFSRLDNPLSVQVGGNGLGLYWSQKIVALHHGTIDVSSKLGVGTTFSIRLPLGKIN